MFVQVNISIRSLYDRKVYPCPFNSDITLFLLGILDMRKDGVYFDGSNSVNLGPLSRMGKRPGFDQSEKRWNDPRMTFVVSPSSV